MKAANDSRIVGRVGVGRGSMLSEKHRLCFDFHDFVNLPSQPGVATTSPPLFCHGRLWTIKLYPGGKTNTSNGNHHHHNIGGIGAVVSDDDNHNPNNISLIEQNRSLSTTITPLSTSYSLNDSYDTSFLSLEDRYVSVSLNLYYPEDNMKALDDDKANNNDDDDDEVDVKFSIWAGSKDRSSSAKLNKKRKGVGFNNFVKRSDILAMDSPMNHHAPPATTTTTPTHTSIAGATTSSSSHATKTTTKQGNNTTLATTNSMNDNANNSNNEYDAYLDENGTFTITVDLQILTDRPQKWIPKSTLSKDMYQMYKNAQNDADITFVVQGQQFYAHHLILKYRAPELAKLADAFPRQENATKTTTDIRVDGVEPYIFDALMYFIYMDELPTNYGNKYEEDDDNESYHDTLFDNVDDDNAEEEEESRAAKDVNVTQSTTCTKHYNPMINLKKDAVALLEVADKVGCERLRFLAEIELAAAGIGVANCADLFVLADLKNYIILREATMNYFRAHPMSVMATAGWNRMKESKRGITLISELLEVVTVRKESLFTNKIAKTNTQPPVAPVKKNATTAAATEEDTATRGAGAEASVMTGSTTTTRYLISDENNTGIMEDDGMDDIDDDDDSENPKDHDVLSQYSDSVLTNHSQNSHYGTPDSSLLKNISERSNGLLKTSSERSAARGMYDKHVLNNNNKKGANYYTSILDQVSDKVGVGSHISGSSTISSQNSVVYGGGLLQ